MESWHSHGTDIAIPLADMLLCSNESEVLDRLINDSERKLAESFNLSSHYTDDFISFNNNGFGEFICDIYHKMLTVFEVIESTSVPPYLDFLSTKLA